MSTPSTSATGSVPTPSTRDGVSFHASPLLIGSAIAAFASTILLAVACWRSGRLPRVPLALLVTFLVWDFLLPAAPPLQPHVLLFVSLAWLGVHVARMGDASWAGHRA